jgi:hypothetical protein
VKTPEGSCFLFFSLFFFFFKDWLASAVDREGNLGCGGRLQCPQDKETAPYRRGWLCAVVRFAADICGFISDSSGAALWQFGGWWSGHAHVEDCWSVFGGRLSSGSTVSAGKMIFRKNVLFLSV